MEGICPPGEEIYEDTTGKGAEFIVLLGYHILFQFAASARTDSPERGTPSATNSILLPCAR